MARGGLLLLSAYLLVWIPVNFAAELAGSLATLGFRGPAAIAELAVHGAAAALAFAAGWALRSGNHDAERLAAAAVALTTATAVQSIYWTSLPRQTRPGSELPLALLYGAIGAAWLLYLRRRARLSR